MLLLPVPTPSPRPSSCHRYPYPTPRVTSFLCPSPPPTCFICPPPSPRPPLPPLLLPATLPATSSTSPSPAHPPLHPRDLSLVTAHPTPPPPLPLPVPTPDEEGLDEGLDLVVAVEKNRIEADDLVLGDADKAVATGEAPKLHLWAKRWVPLVEGQVEGCHGGSLVVTAKWEGMGEVVGDGIGGVEEEGDIHEGGAAKGAIGEEPGGVLRDASVQLGEGSTTQGRDRLLHYGLELRE